MTQNTDLLICLEVRIGWKFQKGAVDLPGTAAVYMTKIPRI